MYREPGKLARQICYQDQTLLIIKFIHKEVGKVDCYLMDLVVQRAHHQELKYLFCTLSSFTFSSYQVKYSRKRENQEQRVQTLYSDHLSPPQGKGKLILRMTPSKKKSLKLKEVSLDPSIRVGTAIIELLNDENKLFDEEDDVRIFTIRDLSLPSEDEEEEV